MTNRVVLRLGLVIVAIGIFLGAIGAVCSKSLTGEWLGYPLPTYVGVLIGIGSLTFSFGLLVVAGYGVLTLVERTGVRRVMETTIVKDSHPIARLGTLVLRANHAVHLAFGVLVLLLVAWGALVDWRIAAILGATAAIVGCIYALGKSRNLWE
jgi:hypothetical protein